MPQHGFKESILPPIEKRCPRYGSNHYSGNWPGELVHMAINHMEGRFGDELSVNEVFMGSGTTSDVCFERNVPYWGVDLRPAPRQPRPGENWETCASHWYPTPHSLGFSHPVYAGPHGPVYHYSKIWSNNAHPRDLSAMPYNQLIEVLNVLHARMYAALEPGGLLVVMVGLVRKKGQITSMANDLAKFGMLEGWLVRPQRNYSSQNKQYGANFIKTVHEDILLMKKHDRFNIMVKYCTFKNEDMRQWRMNITWPTVVYEVLHALGGQATLKEIYQKTAEMFPEKVKTNNTYEATIRRVLQTSKNYNFRRIDRGYWGTAA
jgi:hypothetical protein